MLLTSAHQPNTTGSSFLLVGRSTQEAYISHRKRSFGPAHDRSSREQEKASMSSRIDKNLTFFHFWDLANFDWII
jgi:hypothetical protein